MRAAVVRGDDLDVQVLLAVIELVFDADVGEVDRLIEIWQLVLAGPLRDLARVPIGPTIAVGPAAIGFLEPLLVLALELVVQDNAVDVRALVP